jgi:hypothetical protein
MMMSHGFRAEFESHISFHIIGEQLCLFQAQTSSWKLTSASSPNFFTNYMKWYEHFHALTFFRSTFLSSPGGRNFQVLVVRSWLKHIQETHLTSSSVMFVRSSLAFWVTCWVTCCAPPVRQAQVSSLWSRHYDTNPHTSTSNFLKKTY